MSIRIPYSRQEVTEADIAAVSAALRGPLLTQGPEVAAFEREFAAATGAEACVTVINGTAALHLAFLSCGLGPARGLLTTPLTFLATANAARMLDAPVAFADVDPGTGLLTPETVRAGLDAAPFRVGAVAVVHLAGRVADLPGIRAVTAEYGCDLVEDACHAPGAAYRGPDGAVHRVGACAHSDLAAFSFHPVKHIAMGEGGAITCAEDRAGKLRLARSHGTSRDPAAWLHPPEPNAPWYYEMAELGWNYRLTDLQCALGRGQLARLFQGIDRRRDLEARYRSLLAGIPHLTLPDSPAMAEMNAWHLYPVAIDFAALGRTRGQIMRELAARGIGSQVHYIPLTDQPYYRALGAVTPPGARTYYERTLSIPLFPSMTEAEQDEVAAALRAVLAS